MGFNRDLVARAMAANAKAYAEAAIAAIPKGISYKGEVNYYSDLPTATAEVGDCYTVKYTGTSGTNPDGNEYVFGASGGTNTWIKLGPEDSGGLFYCTYGTTTFAQISAALGAGKMPIVKTLPSGTYYIFAGLATATSYGFSSLYGTTSNALLVDTSNNWTTTTTTLETTTNKVTSVSDQSTNIQYPSAAAVYNFVNEGVPYLTTAPTEDNTSGKLKVVVLDSEPVTKYDGYLYLIAPTPPQTYTVTLYGQSWGTDIETDAQCNETFYIAFNRTPVDITTDYDYRTALSPIEIHQNHYESDFGYDLYDSTGTLQTQPVTVQNVSYATVGLRSTDYIEGTTSPFANVKVVQYDCSDINSPIGWAEMEEQNPPMWTVTIGEDQIIQVTEDMDLSLVGCVSDGYTPDPSSSSYSSSSY